MTLKDMISRVRQNTRDITGSLFSQEDIISFLNEAIDRMKMIKELSQMDYLSSLSDEPNFLPQHFHHLITIYATSRCYNQDEQYQISVQFMNEFETKMLDLINAINNGDVTISDYTPDGNTSIDYVVDVYFKGGVR